MRARHTPGPWRVVANADHGKAEKIVGRDGNAVAFLRWGNGQGQRPAEEVNADAYLAAAAPELLEAAAHLFNLANHFHVGDVWFTDSDEHREALEGLEAAIARATGEEAPYG